MAFRQLNQIEINEIVNDENMNYNIAYDPKAGNHSEEFVASDGIHTSGIKATWWALKRYIPKKCGNVDINECL